MRYASQAKDDATYVAFRAIPALGKWIFRRHWTSAVGAEAVRRHFTPSYNPWRQRVAMALGMKEQLRSGRLRIVTGEIDRFTQRSIILRDGSELPCDICVLATGFDLRFFKFPLLVDGVAVCTDRINVYKGMMLGGVPNYFQPVGVWHGAWTP